jgi:hypothetical protein
MDGSRFDAFTRLLGSDTRRSVLQLFTATALGGALLGASGAEDVDAKCVNPGKKCKKKNGKKKKCCGGAKCKGKKCKCTNGGVACGSTCCAPGQVCQDAGSSTCVNGPLQPGAQCDPDAPLGCQSGICSCITLEDLTSCTCRQEGCFGQNVECTQTSQCCEGFCSEFENPDSCQPFN